MISCNSNLFISNSNITVVWSGTPHAEYVVKSNKTAKDTHLIGPIGGKKRLSIFKLYFNFKGPNWGTEETRRLIPFHSCNFLNTTGHAYLLSFRLPRRAGHVTLSKSTGLIRSPSSPSSPSAECYSYTTVNIPTRQWP